MRLLKYLAIGATACIGIVPAFAQDGWSADPWPRTTPGGNETCSLTYDAAPRGFAITQLKRVSYFVSLLNPDWANLPDSTSFVLLFPSGWQATATATATRSGSGAFKITLDASYFNKLLDELQTDGSLLIVGGDKIMTITVPDQLERRIDTLRGPLTGVRAGQKSCIEQFSDG